MPSRIKTKHPASCKRWASSRRAKRHRLPAADHILRGGSWPTRRSPGSRTRSFHACQGLRPRRAGRVLAFAHSPMLPSALWTASVPGITLFRGSMAGLHAPPTDASPTPSRRPAHGSGPMWFATPSSQWTFTIYSLPVSRRTQRSASPANQIIPGEDWTGAFSSPARLG